MRTGELRSMFSLFAREAAFRVICRHRQGPRRNILLYCTRRGGSTWLLNTLAAHRGMRSVGRPFLSLMQSRWRGLVPDLESAAGGPLPDGNRRRHVIHFEGDAEGRFRDVAGRVLDGRIAIYPTLALRAPYFHRLTDRIVFQMTAGTPLIEWFDAHFDVRSLILFRHPIPAALSIEREGWPPECAEFIEHRWFRETHLGAAGLALAGRIEREGSLRARHVLDWALKMLVPFRALQSGRHGEWVALAYEDMVSEPEATVRRLAARLDLDDVDAMLAQARRPSRTVSGETAERVGDPAHLLRRWRRRVGPEEEAELLAIPAALGIDLYRVGVDGPARPLAPAEAVS